MSDDEERTYYYAPFEGRGEATFFFAPTDGGRQGREETETLRQDILQNS